MSQKNSQNEPETISQKIAELDKLVAWFESDKFVLEAALDKFNEAKKVAASIEEDLAKLGNTIDVLKKDFSKDS